VAINPIGSAIAIVFAGQAGGLSHVGGCLLLVMVQHLMMTALLAATLSRGVLHHFVVTVLLVKIFQMPVGQHEAGSSEEGN
jgi:hypothetical protein